MLVNVHLDAVTVTNILLHVITIITLKVAKKNLTSDHVYSP